MSKFLLVQTDTPVTRNMSFTNDIDYVDVFETFSTGKFYIMLNENETEPNGDAFVLEKYTEYYYDLDIHTNIEYDITGNVETSLLDKVQAYGSDIFLENAWKQFDVHTTISNYTIEETNYWFGDK